jgi:Protein of unknown function (DUF3738)
MRAFAALLAISALRAQSPDVPDWQKAAGGKMSFELASVKRFTTPPPPTFPLDAGNAKPPGGRFSASFSLAAYISFAYKLEPNVDRAVIDKTGLTERYDFILEYPPENDQLFSKRCASSSD